MTVITEGVEASKWQLTNLPEMQTGTERQFITHWYDSGRITLQILLFSLVTRILRAGGEVWSA